MITFIFINRHQAQLNREFGTNEPIITVRDDAGDRVCHEVAIEGPSEVIYSLDSPLPGVVAWVQTEAPVRVVR